MRGILTHRARLLYGFLRAGNDILVFDRFNPKARGKIGQVRDDGHERPPGIDACPTFANLAVEMRNDGDKEVRPIFAPMILEQIHEWLVKKLNGPLQKAQKVCAAESPTVLQKNVVLLLNANPRQLAQNVKLVGKILELYKFDLPITRLL